MTPKFQGKPPERLEELLAEIRDKCENLLAASTLPVPASTHLEGLTGGLRSIVESIDEAGISRE